MRRYGAPSSTSRALSVTRAMTPFGNSSSASATAPEMDSPAYSAAPMQRLIASTSPLPQYWLTRTVRPLMRPRMMICTRKTGGLAAVTADSSSCPSSPTMKVSTKPREVVMRFCKTSGRARRTSRL